MRKVATLNDASMAHALGEYLRGLGISNQVDPEEDSHSWAVWVHDDDQLDAARERAQFFREHPTDPSIRATLQNARAIREQQEREKKEFRGQPVDVRTQWHKESMRPMWMTQTLVGICMVVWVIDNFVPNGRNFTHYLYFSEYDYGGSLWNILLAVLSKKLTFSQAFSGNYWFVEIQRGQIWRLLTPIFMHASIGKGVGIIGIIHILFNMSWLRMLGPMIERRQGAWMLLAKVVVIGIASNLCQYVASGPRFLGFSGVIYGLFGYIWIFGRYNPDPDFYIDRSTVQLMVIWMFLGIFHMIPGMANMAHAGGLVAGMLWGYASSGRLRWKMRRMMR